MSVLERLSRFAPFARFRAWLRQDASPILPPERSLLAYPELLPKDFLHGVEIYNDHGTPMDFVVHVLMHHIHLSNDAAIKAMLEIHAKGGKLFSIAPWSYAQQVAEAVTQEAVKKQFPLLCRAVSLDPNAPESTANTPMTSEQNPYAPPRASLE